MPQVINTNVYSLNAQRNLDKTGMDMRQVLQRLSSGLRINTARDDAAGLAISSRFTTQIRGYNQGTRNAADAISLSQTAEGALTEVTNNLQRIRELAIQSANATNSSSDQWALQVEIKNLKAEITRTSYTQFNGVQVVGQGAKSFIFQVGPNADADANTVTIATTNLRSTQAYINLVGSTYPPATTGLSLGTTHGFGYVFVSGQTATENADTARSLIKYVDDFLTVVNTQRANLGAAQNRFEAVIRNGKNIAEQLSASRSRIMDADFAAETARLTKTQILQQAGTSVLSQANAVPQGVLQLLQG